MDIDGSFTVDDGWHPYGVHKAVTFEGDQVITKLTYDAEPFIEAAKAERIATAGNKWGEGIGTKVGTMPMAVYNQMMKIKGTEERSKFAHKWLLENPAFITFDRFGK